MAKPDSSAAHRTSIKIPPDLQAELEAAAAARLLGRDRLIEVLLRDGLERLTPLDELVLLRSIPTAPPRPRPLETS